MKYILELDKEQLRVVNEALDLYARIGIGQLDRVVDLFRMLDVGGDVEKYEAADRIIVDLKDRLFKLSMFASYGIHNQKVDNRFRVAFDITSVIQHHWWKEEGGKSYSVHAHEPSSSVILQPLATIEVRQ